MMKAIHTHTHTDAKSISMTMDTVSISPNAMEMLQNQNTSLLSILENASTGQTPAERAADGRRAAQAMRTEREAEDMKQGTLVLAENQEAYEQQIKEASAEREEANSDNTSDENATSADNTTSNASSSKIKDTNSEASTQVEASENLE